MLRQPAQSLACNCSRSPPRGLITRSMVILEDSNTVKGAWEKSYHFEMILTIPNTSSVYKTVQKFLYTILDVWSQQIQLVGTV